MVLCNSQREEGLVPSQICRTSNRVIPQNYKINLEPIFNFLRLFCWIIVEKQVCRGVPKKHFSLRRKLHRSYFLSCYFWTNWPEVALSETLRMSEQPSSKDDVRRGLGMLPQQADLQKSWTCTGLHCLPICEGAKYGSNLFPTWVQVKLRVLTIGPVPKSGTSQRAGTVPLAKLARSNFVPVWHEVRTDNWQISTSDQFVHKSLRELHLHGVLAPACRSFSSTLPH